MRKVNLYGLILTMLGVLILPLEAIPSHDQPHASSEHSASSKSASAFDDDDDDDDDGDDEDEYDIMERNAIDDTDTLAIPFDDSEVEDEEEINQLEKKEVFQLPRSR